MMSIPAALQAHYESGGTSVAAAIVIQRQDGLLYGFTSHDQPFDLDISLFAEFDPGSPTTITFDSAQGFDASALRSTAGLNVDNLELRTLDDGSLFDYYELLAGLWDDAKFRIFRYRHDVSPVTIANDVQTLMRGNFGNIKPGQNSIIIELRGLQQKLQQPVFINSTKTCRARLGSTTGRNKCRKDLTSFTHSLTVTGVASKQVFTCSGATQGADYFGEGLVTFSSGNNAGVTAKVREFSAGVFTLVLPVVQDIQVGDTLTAVAGCRKRLIEDCKNKFNNVVNFQGEPHRPTTDDLTRGP